MCNLSYREIENILYNLSEKFLCIDFKKKPQLKNENFFSEYIKADPCELALFLLALEKKCNILLDDNELINYKFNSFNSVLKLVLDKLF